jgi:hypothetical protein
VKGLTGAFEIASTLENAYTPPGSDVLADLVHELLTGQLGDYENVQAYANKITRLHLRAVESIRSLSWMTDG